MSVIRRVNADTEDLMFDIIHDLVERADVFGLPNIGMYESRDELYFNDKAVTTIGIAPDNIHVVAQNQNPSGDSRILIRFYRVNIPKKPGGAPEEIARYDFVASTQEGNGLTRAALAIAIFFFTQRGWFNDNGDEIVDGITKSDRIWEKVTDWTGTYFPGYEERGAPIFQEYMKMADRPLNTKESGEPTK